jgi:hypothetical protein
LFVVLNFLTVMWYNPGMDTDCPPWVYASCAIGMFLYQTFDAVDGMQAYVLSDLMGVKVLVADLIQAEDEAEWAAGRAL